MSQTMTKVAGSGEAARPLRRLFIIVILLITIGFFFWDAIQAESLNPLDMETKTTGVKRSSEADVRCHFICQERRKVRLQKFNGVDLLDPKQVLHAVLASKAKMVNNLKKDYGEEYFTKIFVDPDSSSIKVPTPAADDEDTDTHPGRRTVQRRRRQVQEEEGTNPIRYRGIDPVNSEGDSVNRLHRKMLMKFVQAQAELRQQESSMDGCDCINGDRALGGEIPTNNTTSYWNVDSTYAKFVWATGGHSASAGHGNLFNESYTAFLERAVKDVFASMGVDFEGRNYAMGGTSSGMEISMCSEAVFGNDVDFLSWDYGMTDGECYTRLLHYFYRASLLPGRPAFMGMTMDTRKNNPRVDLLMTLDQMGMAAFWVDHATNEKMYEAIPDTMGMTEEAINAMPDLLRNFKCSERIETGDPYCRRDKYNEAICKERYAYASWHPGFKVMALDGNRLALFLAQTLTDVLEEYVKRESHPKPDEILAELLAEEDLLYQEFKAAPLPEMANNLKLDTGASNAKWVIPEDIDVETFFRGPNICHTGRTPAQTRFLGILTDTDKIGGQEIFGHETYDVGITHDDAVQTDAKGEMRLVYNPGERDHHCPVVLKPDYKDYFFAHGKDGWVKLVVPNKAEKRHYSYDPAAIKGIIMIFFGGCDWGVCEKGDLQIDAFREGILEFEVNGKPVTNLTLIGDTRDGFLLKGEQGVNWTPNGEGVFEIRSNVKDPDGYLRLSSIVVY